MSRHLLGADGPEARLSGLAAFLLLPAVRAWCDGMSARAPSKVAAIEDQIDAIEAAAAAYAQRMSANAPTASSNGHGGARSISTREAADMLNVTEAHVRRLARDRKLDATKVGRDWRIDAAAAAAHRDTRS